MNNAEFQLQGVGDPRLAVHATSPLAAWLWSIDGKRVLWANPVGAGLFGAENGASLSRKTFGPADSHRRQVARLAHRLPPTGAIRLERLRGFGAALGGLITCGCARLEFADGGEGILIAATEPVGRAMPLVERLRRLVEGIDAPIAAFARDGLLVGASDAARSLPGFHNLSEASLEEARGEALTRGLSEVPVGIGHLVLQRVGTGADVGLVALIAPGATQAAHVLHHGVRLGVPPSTEDGASAPTPQRVAPPGDLPVAEYERPAMSGEAPAEFALIDEFAETTEEPAVEPIATEQQAPHRQFVAQPEMSQAETSQGETPTTTASAIEFHPDEPAPAAPTTTATIAPVPPSIAPQPVTASPSFDEPSPRSRRHPLRFTWQMDAEGRFSLGPDEFTRLIGARIAAGLAGHGAKSPRLSRWILTAASPRRSRHAAPGAASP